MKLSTIVLATLALAFVLPVQAQETLNPAGGDYSLTEPSSGDGSESSSELQQRRANYDAWQSRFCSSVNTAGFCSTNGGSNGSSNGSIYGSQDD